MTLFVVWEWLNDNNNYLPYSEIVSSELEKALVANVKEVGRLLCTFTAVMVLSFHVR